jgi:formylglycine-generating enzyme required for sulfatase activity
MPWNKEGEPLSVYTRYLVEGLKTGAAAPEGKDYVAVGHLHDYVKGKVQTAAPTMNPTIFNGLAGRFWPNELRFRKAAERYIETETARISLVGKRYLKTFAVRLGIAPQRAQTIVDEVLRLTLAGLGCGGLVVAVSARPILQALNSAPTPDPTPEPVTEPDFPEPVIDFANPPPAPEGKTLEVKEFEVVTVNDTGEIANRETAQAQQFTEDLGNGVLLEMVAIPPGKFTMGSSEDEAERRDAEGPRRRVTVPAFFIGKYAVTQAQYQAITGQNPSAFKENGANRPVEQVNCGEAIAFCEALSQQTGHTYRLPSEAEWEYTCRAGTETPFAFGVTITPDLANYNGNRVYGQGPEGTALEQTTEVGQFPPNRFGLYDLHGNVWEWCQDTWHDNYEGAPVDSSAWMEGDHQTRVVRGGAWSSLPWDCRSACRYLQLLGERYDFLGFRVVCSAPRAS